MRQDATQAKLARLAMWDRIIVEAKARRGDKSRVASNPAFRYIGAIGAFSRRFTGI